MEGRAHNVSRGGTLPGSGGEGDGGRSRGRERDRESKTVERERERALVNRTPTFNFFFN